MSVLSFNLKTLRERRNFSLQDVSNITGISKPHIWQLETGKSQNPTLEVLRSLAKCYETKIYILIGEK